MQHLLSLARCRPFTASLPCQFAILAAAAIARLLRDPRYLYWLTWLPAFELEVSLFKQSRIELKSDDRYWLRLLSSNYHYEPEVADLLKRALHKDVYFVDGGANIGYWSLMAAEILSSPKRILAVEASSYSYARLQKNLNHNGLLLHSSQRALSDQAGQHLTFSSNATYHSCAALEQSMMNNVKQWARPDTFYSEEVVTETLDNLVAATWPDSSAPSDIIIKLDIEGGEVNAFRGAKTLIERHNPLFIYEDHGLDAEHRATRYLLEADSCRIFFMQTTPWIEIRNLEQLAALKTDAITGYNLIAFKKNSDWPAKLGLTL